MTMSCTTSLIPTSSSLRKAGACILPRASLPVGQRAHDAAADKREDDVRAAREHARVEDVEAQLVVVEQTAAGRLIYSRKFSSTAIRPARSGHGRNFDLNCLSARGSAPLLDDGEAASGLPYHHEGGGGGIGGGGPGWCSLDGRAKVGTSCGRACVWSQASYAGQMAPAAREGGCACRDECEVELWKTCDVVL